MQIIFGYTCGDFLASLSYKIIIITTNNNYYNLNFVSSYCNCFVVHAFKWIVLNSITHVSLSCFPLVSLEKVLLVTYYTNISIILARFHKGAFLLLLFFIFQRFTPIGPTTG